MRSVFVALIFAVGIYAWALKPGVRALPCTEPITYAIGNFDRGFGISYKEFLEALTEAEAVWEKHSDKELFSYLPEKGNLAVNLIYDYRQQVTNTLSDITEVVEENESTYKSLHEEFKRLKSQYDSAENVYDGLVSVFNKKSQEYEKLVEEWNSGPRTSKELFKRLEEKRIELQKDLSELKLVESNLNEQGRQINLLVERLNRLASSLNLDVEKFNTIGAQRGETFTGGLYIINPIGDRSIDIFEFRNREKLVRVLAHEFGHALGIEHVSEPRAIMYYLNQGENKMLTEADISGLRALCGDR